MSIISKLKAAGDLKLYHDYRASDVVDRSGNSNDGTPSATQWTNSGTQFPTTSSRILVSEDNSLDFTTCSVVLLFDEIMDVTNLDTILSKRTASGIDWEVYFNGTSVSFYAPAGSDNYTGTSAIGSKMIGISKVSGATMKVYHDGIFQGTGGASTAYTSDDQDLYIGNYYLTGRNISDTLQAVLIVNRVLTETEMAEAYAELEAMTWPTKPITKSQASLEVNPSEAGLVAGWNMKPVNGKVIDQSSNGNDLTISGATQQNTLMGSSLLYDLVDDYAVKTGANLYNSTMTIRTLIKTGSDTSTQQVLFMTASGDRIVLSIEGNVFKSNHFTGSSNGRNSSTIAGDKIYDVVLTLDTGVSDNPNIYVDGVLDNAGTSAPANVDSTNSISVGNRTNTAYDIPFGGNIISVEVYNEVKSADWIAQEYAKGKVAGWKTDWGANVSVATEGGTSDAYLSNTPFQFSDTAFRGKISSDTIEGTPVKVIECTTAGRLYLKTDNLGQTPTESAYGTWEFWFNKHDNSTYEGMIIGTSKEAFGDAGQNGYLIQTNSGERLLIFRITGGGYAQKLSSDNAMTAGTYQKHKITRSGAGVMSYYIDGTLLTADGGHNPFTDATHTTSTFMTFDMDAGDKIAYSDVGGNHSFFKSLTI